MNESLYYTGGEVFVIPQRVYESVLLIIIITALFVSMAIIAWRYNQK